MTSLFSRHAVSSLRSRSLHPEDSDITRQRSAGGSQLLKRNPITPFSIHVGKMTIVDLAAATITAPLTVYHDLDRS
ncbi:hypothetical protein RvY_01584 [Ramazzottius varieornatus]|uniref:Uncharacterized protein n=1 Tax=Ramazzottius varieornatus TaxID=947166 RepID=A0A1D1UKA6_RAMVA|nr:hypothetical protein RvY_01584 [Ramazzottius varieornatus]